MIHLYATEGSGKFPVCGAYNVPRGDAVTSVLFRDLCPACLEHQVRRSARINRELRRNRRDDNK